LKEAREKKGISMRQAAIDMGFPYTTYVNYEKGISEPNSENLAKIAIYYNVSADYLIGRTEVENPEEWDKEAQEFADGMYEREQLLLRYLSEYFDDAEEKGIASDIVRYLPAFNNTGLKVVKERVEELTCIEKYINSPGR
jgi:transcriptional regulator with XRE-family HTH domain